MTVDDAPAPPPTRRVRAARASSTATEASAVGNAVSATPAPPAASSAAGVVGTLGQATPVPPTSTLPPTAVRPSASRRLAIGWVDEDAIARTPHAVGSLDAAAFPYVPVGPELLSDPPHRSILRAGVLVPFAILVFVIAAYSGTTLLWPLHAVAPAVAAVDVAPVSAPAAALTWPGTGSAAVSVAGMDGALSSSDDASPIASITKVVTALLVLDQMPLALGEQGPEFRFTSRDSDAYWEYRANNESALDVPVDGSLSQYQLLQGMLIGSANNYADRLAGNLWPTDAVFASAAEGWLSAHGVTGVTVVEPTGLDPRNTATPEALLALAQRAMADPVIAQIVATPAVELPGAGLVTNTNGLLADPGVVGIKTGSLDAYTLLSAKDIVIGATTVRVYGSMLGQPDDESRLAATRTLYAEMEAGLQPTPTVLQGTVVGTATTEWGEEAAIVAEDDAAVIVWNGGAGAATTDFTLGDAREKGADVGTLSVAGPLDSASTTLELAEDIEPPSAWWRLTHPLDLFGLT